MGAPTFNWTGAATHVSDRIYYNSFSFSDVKYSVGDYVYLLPEEEGSALYIAKIRRAFENTLAADEQKLCIEVQWLERPSSMPDAFQTRMHERELVESDLSDTNLVGCIDRKALVVVAASYEEALERIPPEDRDSDWYFCSGVYETASGMFKPFPVAHKGMVPLSNLTGANGTGPAHDNGDTSVFIRHSTSSRDNGYDDGDELLQATKRRRGASDLLLSFNDQPMADAYGATTSDGLEDSPALMLTGTTVNPQALMEMLQRVQANGGPMPIASLAFPEPLPEEEAAAPAPAAPAPLPPAPRHGRKSQAPQNSAGTQSLGAARRIGVPGRVCAECGATTTPQWREGPQGPKTLCNACGVRYHRQNKAKANNKRAPSEPKPPAPVKAPPPPKKRAGPSGSRQSARQAQKAAAGSRRGQLMDSDGEGGSGGSPFKSASRGRRSRLDAFGHEEEDGWDGYGEQEDELEVVQGMRKRGSLQRMQTSEAADVLQTFRMGGHSGMGRAAHSSSPYDGNDGQLLSESGLHSDLLPHLHMDGGTHGSPALAGEGQSQRSASPLIRAALRGRVGPDSSARGQDSPAPLILAATAPVDALGALKHGVSAFKRGALVHPSLNLHVQVPSVAGTSNGHLEAGRRAKGSSVLSALPVHLAGQHPMQVTASGDSWHTSDSTEEVAYEPLRAAAAAATAAAASAGAVTAGAGEGRALKLGALEDWAPELVGYGQLYEAIPKLLTSLPEEHAAQLVAAKQNVDAAAREAKAADAAVQAVSQVLGVKRQAAEDARRCADERVASLRNLMLSLSKQHGIAGVDISRDAKPAAPAATVSGQQTAAAAANSMKLEQDMRTAGGVAAAVAKALANQQQHQQGQRQQALQQQQPQGATQQQHHSLDLMLQEDAQHKQQAQQHEADMMIEDASGAAQLLADSGPTQMDMEAVIGADWQSLASGLDVTGHMATSNGNSSYGALQSGADGLAMPLLQQPQQQQPQQQPQQQLGKQERAQDGSGFLQGVNELLGVASQPSAVGAGA